MEVFFMCIFSSLSHLDVRLNPEKDIKGCQLVQLHFG